MPARYTSLSVTSSDHTSFEPIISTIKQGISNDSDRSGGCNNTAMSGILHSFGVKQLLCSGILQSYQVTSSITPSTLRKNSLASCFFTQASKSGASMSKIGLCSGQARSCTLLRSLRSISVDTYS